MIRQTLAALVISLLVATIGAGASAASSPSGLIALYHGRQIPLSSVARYQCHDALDSRILCFDSAQARDASFRSVVGLTDAILTPSSVSYVEFFADINYGGSSFIAADPIPDLRAIGWNDRISSFRSENAGHPKWWMDINYVGTAWQWTAGSSVAYVGNGANDQFSSVQNVP